jgi:hypothetical protein
MKLLTGWYPQCKLRLGRELAWLRVKVQHFWVRVLQEHSTPGLTMDHEHSSNNASNSISHDLKQELVDTEVRLGHLRVHKILPSFEVEATSTVIDLELG